MGNPDEQQVHLFSRMPPGYRFVPKGDVYITKNCRQRTHEAGKPLYVVVDKKNRPLGLRCPKEVYDAVQAGHQATADKRARAVQRRDAALEGNFEEAVLKFFPKTPREYIPQIVKHALEKRSGRVGRTGTVELEAKVNLAVRAHIRHCHTDYDKLLRTGMARHVARNQISQRLNEVAMQWGGKPTKSPRSRRNKVGKPKGKSWVGKKARGRRPSASAAGDVELPTTLAKRTAVLKTRPVNTTASALSGNQDDPIEISSDDDSSFVEDTDTDSDVSAWSDLDGDSEQPWL